MDDVIDFSNLIDTSKYRILECLDYETEIVNGIKTYNYCKKYKVQCLEPLSFFFPLIEVWRDLKTYFDDIIIFNSLESAEEHINDCAAKDYLHKLHSNKKWKVIN